MLIKEEFEFNGENVMINIQQSNSYDLDREFGGTVLKKIKYSPDCLT